MKQVYLLTLLTLMISSNALWAQTEMPAAADATIAVNNKCCPVSKEAVDSMDSKATVVYEGKEYSLCCKHCLKDFEKDPEKYIAEMQENEVSASTEADAHDHQGEDAPHEHS